MAKQNKIQKAAIAQRVQEGKTPLNLQGVPDQIVAAIQHLVKMAKRANGSFDEHVASQQAEIILMRRFKPVAAPLQQPEKKP